MRVGEVVTTEVLYFGCIGDAGHYVHGTLSHGNYRKALPSSIYPKIDSGFLPREQQRQGQAQLCKLDGWTFITFWDRTVDTRPGSNSAFLAEGDFSFDEVCAFAADRFPLVWKRITDAFPVVLAGEQKL